MSTRANIIVQDDNCKLFFYRHSDGYPDGAMPVLEQFLNLVKEGRIRDNCSQASGWLVVLGAKEYETGFKPSDKGARGWKVGSIEPTDGIHGDIEYLYTIDLVKKTINVKEV